MTWSRTFSAGSDPEDSPGDIENERSGPTLAGGRTIAHGGIASTSAARALAVARPTLTCTITVSSTTEKPTNEPPLSAAADAAATLTVGRAGQRGGIRRSAGPSRVHRGDGEVPERDQRHACQRHDRDHKRHRLAAITRSTT